MSHLSPFLLFVNWLIVNSRLVYLISKGMSLVAAGVIALNGGKEWKEEGVQETGELGGKRLSTAIPVNRCACAGCEI